MDEKDRFGNKLHDLEKAREDQFAAERDRELLDKLRDKQSKLRDAAKNVCPNCQQPLVSKTVGKVTMMACPANDGAWLDEKTLKAVLDALE